jgi:hypothetical protein
MARIKWLLPSPQERVAIAAGAQEAHWLIEEKRASGEGNTEAFARGVMVGAYIKLVMAWGPDAAREAVETAQYLTTTSAVPRDEEPRR